ncbi:MAG: hypothetical protein H0X67_07235, partial [Acidobacteria bacterium]|nr:hypothetical protein [Acidobacteriota bacterium]
HTEQVGTSPGPLVVEFPVAVRAIIVRGDDTIRRNVRGMLVEPLSIVRPAERLSPAIARQAVRYAGGAAFFLDEFSYAEPEGFWVAGERASSVVVQPDERTGVAMLLVRNGPVENRVEIEAGKWRERLDMGPGEERSLAVPVTPGRGAGLLTVSSAAGFRPSEVEAGSRDNRYLGVWVTLLGSRQ